MDNKRYFSFNSTKTKIIYKFFLNGTEIEKILYKTLPINCLKSKLYQKSFT